MAKRRDPVHSILRFFPPKAKVVVSEHADPQYAEPIKGKGCLIGQVTNPILLAEKEKFENTTKIDDFWKVTKLPKNTPAPAPPAPPRNPKHPTEIKQIAAKIVSRSPSPPAPARPAAPCVYVATTILADELDYNELDPEWPVLRERNLMSAVDAETLPVCSHDASSVFSRIALHLGDITTLAVDVIVNAANVELRGGGGVDGAIHRRAGPILMRYTRQHYSSCPVGEARVSPAYRLPCKYVIHTVGPIKDDEPLLRAAYQSSLELAGVYDAKSIAFPSISTGVYGFPLEKACTVAITTVVEFLRAHQEVEKVVFVLFSKHDFAAYERRVRGLLTTD